MRSSTVFVVFLFVKLNYMQTRLVRLGSLFLLTFFTRMMFVKDHCFPIMNIHGRINPSPGAPHYVLCSPIHSVPPPDTITLLFNSHSLSIFPFSLSLSLFSPLRPSTFLPRLFDNIYFILRPKEK
jgi:hypothetical protein